LESVVPVCREGAKHLPPKQTTLTDATETSVPLNVGWGIHLIRRLGLEEAEKSKLNGACRGSKLHSLLDR
jgi:hypothetical protein